MLLNKIEPLQINKILFICKGSLIMLEKKHEVGLHVFSKLFYCSV